jgi:hypothetical protein
MPIGSSTWSAPPLAVQRPQSATAGKLWYIPALDAACDIWPDNLPRGLGSHSLHHYGRMELLPAILQADPNCGSPLVSVVGQDR